MFINETLLHVISVKVIPNYSRWSVRSGRLDNHRTDSPMRLACNRFPVTEENFVRPVPQRIFAAKLK